MWKSKRNITITYNPLPASSPQAPPKLESTVAYQTTSSDKIKTVKGIETPSGGENTAAWDWRGKGWLVIASSHWEVLGWGELEGGGGWAVTYFAKTLFTPAGIDIYSRGKEGVGDAVVAEIKNALGRIEHEEMRNLGRELFEIQRD